MDRRNLVADRHWDRVYFVSLVAKHEQDSLSHTAFSVRNLARRIRTVARFHSQVGARVRIRPAQHSPVSRVAGDDSDAGQPRLDVSMGEYRCAGNGAGSQLGRMAPELSAIAHGALAGRGARHECRACGPVGATALFAAFKPALVASLSTHT